MTAISTIVVAAFVLVLIIALRIGYRWGQKRIPPSEIQKAVERSRATVKGQLSEQIAPLLPGFPKDLKASEARFLGKPVDFLFFKGMDEEDITDVVFLEVKTGKSSLNDNQKTLRDAIQGKRVEWRVYRISEEVTKKSDVAIPLSSRST